MKTKVLASEEEPVKVPLLLTAAEVAIILGISEAGVKRLGRRGILDTVRPEPSLVRYDAAALLKFLEAKVVTAHDPCRKDWLEASMSDAVRALESHLARAKEFLEQLRAERERALEVAKNRPSRGRRAAQTG